jgi:hypothetical protein
MPKRVGPKQFLGAKFFLKVQEISRMEKSSQEKKRSLAR